MGRCSSQSLMNLRGTAGSAHEPRFLTHCRTTHECIARQTRRTRIGQSARQATWNRQPGDAVIGRGTTAEAVQGPLKVRAGTPVPALRHCTTSTESYRDMSRDLLDQHLRGASACQPVRCYQVPTYGRRMPEHGSAGLAPSAPTPLYRKRADVRSAERRA